jgi:endonuclease YncB( thermonuclease family)
MISRLIFAAVMLLISTTIALSDDMTGQASIIDGDTLEIHGSRIRLWGVDAPESDQLCRGEDSLQYRCGAKAANELVVKIRRLVPAPFPTAATQLRSFRECRCSPVSGRGKFPVNPSQTAISVEHVMAISD